MTDEEFNALTHEAAGKITRALAGYRKEVRFYALLNVLLMAMAYDPDHLERMAEFIGGFDWIGTAGQWRKLIDNGYHPTLICEQKNEPQNYEPQNYQ
jgi:hypothetical protein